MWVHRVVVYKKENGVRSMHSPRRVDKNATYVKPVRTERTEKKSVLDVR